MSDIIQQLHKDHVNVSKLLDMLERQIELFHQRGTPNYLLLMVDAMLYLLHYADAFHHPMEDVVFRKLKELDPGVQSLVDDLVKEHEILAEKGVQFFESLRVVESEDLMLRDTLESRGRDYIASLRRHMHKEEDQLFPLASRVLRDKDWEAIDAAMEKKGDPLFGEAIEEQYRTLYDALVQQGE